MARGRPTKSIEERREILEGVIDEYVELGITRACKANGISYQTFYNWIIEFEDLFERYARAREIIAHCVEPELEELNERVLGDTVKPDAARVVGEFKKWVAGKRNPKIYGERKAVDLGGQEGKPLQVVVATEDDKDLLHKI